MATTTATGNGHVMTAKPFIETGPPRRNRQRIVFGVLLIVVTALAAVALYGSVGNRRAVLAVGKAVDAGNVIQDTDLVEVKVSADPGLHPIAATQRTQVVGRVAAVPLVPGTLLSSTQLGEGSALPHGMAIVGAVLKPGQAPVGLRKGQHVLVVMAPPTNATASSAQLGNGGPTAAPIPATVSVIEVSPDQNSTLTASLIVPDDIAPDIAVAGADGRVRLVVTNP